MCMTSHKNIGDMLKQKTIERKHTFKHLNNNRSQNITVGIIYSMSKNKLKHGIKENNSFRDIYIQFDTKTKITIRS